MEHAVPLRQALIPAEYATPVCPPLTVAAPSVTLDEQFSPASSKGLAVRAEFLGKDPDSIEGESPTLFATDRTDRVTYIAQGWKVTDPQVLADVGPVPDHETLIEIPEDVLKMYARRYQQETEGDT
ncbi:hypothetical protein [Amycolatopsis palatopharyngis]|uniref:hypothetical protein n=1 Tax=Amycolatopsis palatopharyngis TaxID=187982 RepID=UPI001FE9C8C5|nr:hypothetical protein [Amycolatopsis palatopharyngis]